jgi:hypothetical protein
MTTIRRKLSDDIEMNHESQPMLTGEAKDDQKRKQKMRLEDQDDFVRKGYFLCMVLFLASGVAMIVAVTQGAYKDVVLAETVMVSVLGTAYGVLFVVMICCYGSGQLRIAILLFVSTFVGLVGGFMIGVNLKMVVSHLKD